MTAGTVITKKYLNSESLIYFCFFAMIAMMLFIKHIHIEALEIGVIKQILHPEYPRGSISYSPLCNYDYIMAWSAKCLGLEDNFTALARIFWFLETGLSVLILAKICNYI